MPGSGSQVGVRGHVSDRNDRNFTASCRFVVAARSDRLYAGYMLRAQHSKRGATAHGGPLLRKVVAPGRRLPHLKWIVGVVIAAMAVGVYALASHREQSAVATLYQQTTTTAKQSPSGSRVQTSEQYTANSNVAGSPSGQGAAPAPPTPSGNGPQTSEHYTANSNFSGSTYLPGADGFNLADVSSNSVTEELPPGVEGLAYIGSCAGATAGFQATVASFVGDAKVFGFYLVDEPYVSSCPPANLKAESDWIHSIDPGAKTFFVLQNMSSSATPSYLNTYNPANTDVDLFGLTSYPCQTIATGCDYSWIPLTVAAAERAGIPLADIVPVYQKFGAGQWLLPTAAQESAILSEWGSCVPTPVFDYAYSWGPQPRFGGEALDGSPSLQSVFLSHNG